MKKLRELFIDLLIWAARRTPYSHIYSGGDLYMERFWLLKPRRFLPFSIRVHRIVRGDKDRHLHDHPFGFATWIMRGGYFEELPADQDQDPALDGTFAGTVYAWRNPGDVVFHRASDRHRIHITRGEAWTLFFMTRKKQSWGFYTAAGKVYWREYLNDWTTQVWGES